MPNKLPKNHHRSRVVGVVVIAIGLVTGVVGHASAPAGRYTIANGAVTDTKTNLTWQQVISLGMYTQAEAASYCATLGLNGAMWRLPTMREILTIVDLSVGPPGPTIDATTFPNTPPAFFWSATPYSGSPSNFWSAHFQYGFAYGNTKSDMSYARCLYSGRPPR
jgi:Protein of unknown function (DUF1566)